MPTYVYRCATCGNEIEVVQKISEKEADLKLGKISVTSPIGKGLLGKAIGEVAEVTVPVGLLKFKVENITI